jgi:ATP-dependent RNA helicase DOB1
MKGGRKVVCGSQSGVLGLWSWGYWADCSDRYPGHPESVDALAKYDEDTLITGSSDGALRIISVLPNKLLGVVGSHAADMPVERLSLSHDRRLLASVSHDSVVKLWDVGRLLADDGDGEEGGDGGEGSSGDWEEAGSGEEDQQQQQQQQQQHDGPAPVAPPPGQAAGGSSSIPSTPAAAVAVVAAAAGAGSGGGGGGSSADEEDSDSDSEAGGRKRRKKRGEKTAMRKGGANKHKPGGNFFADLF